MIEAQLAAFQDDDGARAFGFASPAIQQQFGSPSNFLAMVRTAYLPVYRPREVRFRELALVQGEPVQLVLLVGPDLEVVNAFYRDAKAGGRQLADQRLHARAGARRGALTTGHGPVMRRPPRVTRAALPL